MRGRLWPWLLASGAATLAAYLGMRAHGDDARSAEGHEHRGATRSGGTALRNAGLIYRPVGATGERYPAWIDELRGKSGVYVIREIQRDGSSEVVYVGESHSGRLYETLTRHFQAWRRRKRFWSGQY